MTMIFVFGSNIAGRHGKGAALDAFIKHKAIYGQGVGPQGNSYAIPTKDQYLNTLSLESIEEYICMFIRYAIKHPELQFQVTRIGCGLAGYQNKDIAPMFQHAPSNCIFDPAWQQIITSLRSVSQNSGTST